MGCSNMIRGEVWPGRARVALPVELHTVGTKSGKPHVNLLTSPVHDDRRIVVVASKRGHQDHPDWYRNAVLTTRRRPRRGQHQSVGNRLTFVLVAPFTDNTGNKRK